ncbi:hypothetical protein [Bifidobacterium pseudolongum]|uniref:hypothetical protein n=1 Tax=Bifidobacterium pseudolongum TaxID=1694 RepID=UPI001A939E7E|nr:hypothetical protein [Bifidobacterium pseudolongum]
MPQFIDFPVGEAWFDMGAPRGGQIIDISICDRAAFAGNPLGEQVAYARFTGLHVNEIAFIAFRVPSVQVGLRVLAAGE